MQNNSAPSDIIGLDIGNARIGVARANTIAKIPEPLAIIERDGNEYTKIARITQTYSSSMIVIGLPLQTDKNEGDQARLVRKFAVELSDFTNVPQIFTDESLSSIEADEFISDHPNRKFQSNDSVAACIVLQRYLEGTGNV